eukprot:3878759-Rhodomonas_salina.2
MLHCDLPPECVHDEGPRQTRRNFADLAEDHDSFWGVSSESRRDRHRDSFLGLISQSRRGGSWAC